MGMNRNIYIIGWIVYSLLHGIFMVVIVLIMGLIAVGLTSLDILFVLNGIYHQIICLFAVIGFTLFISSLSSRY